MAILGFFCKKYNPGNILLSDGHWLRSVSSTDRLPFHFHLQIHWKWNWCWQRYSLDKVPIKTWLFSVHGMSKWIHTKHPKPFLGIHLTSDILLKSQMGCCLKRHWSDLRPMSKCYPMSVWLIGIKPQCPSKGIMNTRRLQLWKCSLKGIAVPKEVATWWQMPSLMIGTVKSGIMALLAMFFVWECGNFNKICPIFSFLLLMQVSSIIQLYYWQSHCTLIR